MAALGDPNSPTGLKLLVTNACSLRNKLDDLRHALNQHDIDVAIITDTKFSADALTSLDSSIPGYGVPYRRDRNEHLGGVAVWIKSTLASAHLDQLQSAEQETLWVKVRLRGGTSLVIGSVYRPGSCSPTDLCLIDSLDDTLHQAKELSPNVILAGDFNLYSADWLGSAKSTPARDALEDLCITQELTQHVREPTRGANTLDLIMSTFQQPISTTVLAPLGHSDHGTVIAQFPTISPCRGEATTPTVWRYECADWGRLRAHLKAVPWASIITDDPELSCLQVTNTIAAGMDQFIPHKTLVIRSSDPKWWTPECTQVMRIKDREWRK